MLKSVRWIIFSFPVLLALLTLWSAKQAKESRHARHDAFIIASSAKETLTLNPYLSVGEVDIELRKLLHDSPIRSDAAEGLVPGLFEKWQWNQISSFWFATEDLAKKAEEKIRAKPEQWKRWNLEELEVIGSQVSMAFAKAGSSGPMLAFQQVLDFGPLPVEQWRVELTADAKSHHEFFIQNSIEKAQVKRVSFLSDQVYLMEVSGETVRLLDELKRYFENHPKLEAKIRVMGRQAMIHQPEFHGLLRQGAKFRNGSEVTLADIEKSMRFIYDNHWLPDRRDAWSMIETIEIASPQHLKVRFRDLYGPSLNLFVDLPILPAAWLQEHESALKTGVNAFLNDPPTGAGMGSIELLGKRSLSVALPENAGPKRIQLLFGQSSREIRMGFEMNEIDAFWPLSESIDHVTKRDQVDLSRQASMNRLLVLWNCRSAPFDQLEVREAMAMALDRQALIGTMLQGEGAVREGIFAPGSWLSTSPEPRKWDLEAARKKLYDLGYVRNEEGYLVKKQQVLEFKLLTVEGNPERTKLAELLQAAWKELGVRVILEALPLQDIISKKLHTREFDAALMGLNYETHWDQYALWHSSQAVRGLNFAGLISPEIDSILVSLRQEYDGQAIQGLAHDLETQLLKLQPYMTLFCGESTLAIRKQPESERQEKPVSRLLGGGQ